MAHSTKKIQSARPEYTEAKQPYGYTQWLGFKTKNFDDLDKRIRAGFEYATFERMSSVLALSVMELAKVVDIKPRTLSRRKKNARLAWDESDRLLRISRVYDRAMGLFEGDADATHHWISRPVRGLGGRKPLDLVLTEPGASEVEHLIYKLEYGVFI